MQCYTGSMNSAASELDAGAVALGGRRDRKKLETRRALRDAALRLVAERGYDQVIHDVALQNLPVVFAIDRAGLVGADGKAVSATARATRSAARPSP